ncbi:MAG: hypothetical protein WC279_11865 [Sulfurimonas sp.]|jgi:hypothetical protein|uniref:hypothetical protein n=1 Tax=Sulfurimonas sp. TaxID=2022749 RepID=UPI00356268CD
MIRITQDIDRSSKEGPVLTVTALDPEGYSTEITGLRPEAMFVYTRTNINEPSANPFERVATLEDLYSLPFNMSGVRGGLYRTSSFSKSYKTLPAMLKDFTDLDAGIRTYLNNLRTLDSVAVVTGSRSYVYPDYEDAVLKGLIADLKAARFELESLISEKTILQTVILPLLRTQVIQYNALKDAADKLYSDSEGHAQFIGEIQSLKDQTADLRNTLKTFSSGLTLNKTRNMKAVTRFNTLSQLASNISEEDADIKAALLSEITGGTAEADPSADADITVNDDLASTAMRLMLPGLNRVERLEIVKFTGTSNLLSVMDSIKEFGTSVDRAIEQRDTRIKEIDVLQNEVRGNIQRLEAEIMRLRPGMDITRPDTDWNLTVVLN